MIPGNNFRTYAVPNKAKSNNLFEYCHLNFS